MDKYKYKDFITMSEDAVRSENIDLMEWIGLENKKHFIQREMVQLAYHTERSITNPDNIQLREMYRLSILNTILEMKNTLARLQNK